MAADLHDRYAEALTAEHYRRAQAQIVASPEEHSAAMADAVLAVRDEELERLTEEQYETQSKLDDADTEATVWHDEFQKAKAERDALRAAHKEVAEAIRQARRIMTCHSRDWSLHADDAWLYALLVGWDCEIAEHADGGHNEIDCGGPDGLEIFAERFGWTEGGITKLRAQRQALAALDTTDCASCDICGAHPCTGGCWIGEFLGEERHRCVDEDACTAAFNREEATVRRCPSCDHLTSHHQPDGCWYTVISGKPGRDLVCSCEVAPPTPTEKSRHVGVIDPGEPDEGSWCGACGESFPCEEATKETRGDDIEVINMTDAEWDQALANSLAEIGLTWKQLVEQARTSDFSSLQAQQLWRMAGPRGFTTDTTEETTNG